MLEIKNVFSREIDGIPKMEYWIQMQLQMEVCDLDDCDFLETKFIEYENYNDFLNDSIEHYIYYENETKKEKNIFKSLDGKTKGIIIYFIYYKMLPISLSKSLISFLGSLLLI